MSLLAILAAAAVLWMAAAVVTLALCRAAARGDRTIHRSNRKEGNIR